MERFVAAVRRFFGKKDNHNGESHNHDKPNEVQKGERKQHPYDEVTLDDEGPNVVKASPPNEFQSRTRAPRSYDEVELPAEGKVEITQSESAH